jgi:hypothetical protein
MTSRRIIISVQHNIEVHDKAIHDVQVHDAALFSLLWCTTLQCMAVCRATIKISGKTETGKGADCQHRLWVIAWQNKLENLT